MLVSRARHFCFVPTDNSLTPSFEIGGLLSSVVSFKLYIWFILMVFLFRLVT